MTWPKDNTGYAGNLGGTGIQGPAGPAGADGATGATGSPGATGPAGADGLGVPPGGTTAQVLAKKSNADNDTDWVDQTGGGGGGDFLVMQVFS